MTRARYVRLLNLAIERGEAPQFREAYPSPDSCPDVVYEHTFPGSQEPEAMLEIVPDEPKPEVT